MIVMLIAVFQALRCDPDAHFLSWAMVSFLPLLVFQALSLALNLPKGSADGGGLVWIGGYNHEAAFSVALLTGFLVGCLARSAPRAPRVAFLLAATLGIFLRSAAHTSELQSLMRISYAVFFLKKKNR